MNKYKSINFWWSLSLRTFDSFFSVLTIYLSSFIFYQPWAKQSEHNQLGYLEYYLFWFVSIIILITYFYIIPLLVALNWKKLLFKNKYQDQQYFIAPFRTLSMILFKMVYLNKNYKPVNYFELLKRQMMLSGFFIIVLIALMTFVNPGIINKQLKTKESAEEISVLETVLYVLPSTLVTIWIFISVANFVVKLFSYSSESIQDKIFDFKIYHNKTIYEKSLPALRPIRVLNVEVVWKE